MGKKSFLEQITRIKKGSDKSKNTAPSAHSDSPIENSDDGGDWADHKYEGQLSVDVYQTKDDIVIKAAVAGVDPDNLDISINNDMVTIRGMRHPEEEIRPEDYFYQECYFGPFSRSIILPEEVNAEHAIADFKKGILTIRLPKSKQVLKIKINVHEEEEQ